jgi:hypothetical protein
LRNVDDGTLDPGAPNINADTSLRHGSQGNSLGP